MKQNYVENFAQSAAANKKSCGKKNAGFAFGQADNTTANKR